MSIAPPTLEPCACPLCGGSASAPLFVAGDSVFDFPGMFTVARCSACGMLYTNPRVAPADIHAFYPSEYAAHAADGPSLRRRRRGRDPWDGIAPFGLARWLDVGCGSGGMLERRRREGWNVLGIEPSGDAVAAAQQSGIDAVQGVVPGVDIGERRFEVITMLGVIACVPEPRATLTTLRRWLAPNGRLIVSEHNADSAAAGLFGSDWQGWDLPRHYSHFTSETLGRMLRDAGFDNVQISYRRRTSRWRHSAKRKARGGGIRWNMLARSRNLCSLASMVLGRGSRGDELIAVARAD